MVRRGSATADTRDRGRRRDGARPVEPPIRTSSGIATATAIVATLPLDVRASDDGVLAPAIVLSPPHLHTLQQSTTAEGVGTSQYASTAAGSTHGKSDDDESQAEKSEASATHKDKKKDKKDHGKNGDGSIIVVSEDDQDF